MGEVKDDDKILAKEIEAWKGFEYALRKPNADLFSKMLTECLESEEYAAACKTEGPQGSAESLFMALIFQQQKMISKLIQQIESKQKKI
ncbi:MAG: hypothetical protein ACR2IS_08565 [Nitrososphaeraceae archaeon]